LCQAASRLHCGHALDIDPGSVKALFRYAQACLGLSTDADGGSELLVAEAARALRGALGLDPGNREVRVQNLITCFTLEMRLFYMIE
jgi:hypothetical protein